MSIFKAIFKRLKTNEAPPPVSETEFDGNKENDIKSLRAKEPAWKGLKRKYIYYVLLLFIITTMYAMLTGLEDDKKAALEKEQRQANEVRDSKAVTGDHLLNIPKNYTEQAEIETKKKAEAEKQKNLKETEKKQSEKKTDKQLPSSPQIPQQPIYNNRYEPTLAEKERLRKEELRQKAYESPIGFELREVK